MKAFAITLYDNSESLEQVEVLIQSSEFRKHSFAIEKFEAVTPEKVVDSFKSEKLRWNYPWTESFLDIQTGLIKEPYKTADPRKRMACFMSHYLLWKKSATENESLLILEHDAEFIRKFKPQEIEDTAFDIVSLNDPRGATRKSQVYHELIIKHEICSVPWIDDYQVPQGLPGNSAYYIKPAGAKKMIQLVNEYGAWPNDAIMCKQLFGKKLGCLGNYATQVQRKFKSSTTA
jgi:GR25 family glycosyltransferase involved in LPS biosynthesis